MLLVRLTVPLPADNTWAYLTWFTGWNDWIVFFPLTY